MIYSYQYKMEEVVLLCPKEIPQAEDNITYIIPNMLGSCWYFAKFNRYINEIRVRNGVIDPPYDRKDPKQTLERDICFYIYAKQHLSDDKWQKCKHLDYKVYLDCICPAIAKGKIIGGFAELQSILND